MSLLAAMFAVSVSMMVVQQMQYRKTIADTEDAARLAGLQTGAESQRPETVPPVEETVPPTEEPLQPLPEEALDLAGVDLEALREVNTDVVGWIAIPDTVVSYPLVYGTDNEYYLHHNWKKESIDSGSVFLSSDASRDMTDFHTIIYAHYMRNGTMFGSIKYYSGEDYWREHPSIYIVLDDAIYRYDIFSAHEAAADGIVYWLNIEEKSLEEKFLQYCIDQSVLDTGLSPGAGDRILTLSTCTSDSNQAYRWVIHGVLAQKYSRTNI